MEYKTITVNVTTGETTESIVPMTAEEISKAQQEQAYVDANKYKDLRAAEYPPIGDQLDALWKGGEAAAEMLAKEQAVKAKYPKGAIK
jgi:hypothetical protein